MKIKNILLTLIALAIFVPAIQAQNWWKNGMKGEGPTVTKTLNVSSFDAVKLMFSGDVYLKQGSSQSVTVEGQQNIIDNIETAVSNNLWKIKFDKPVRDYKDLKIYITVPTLTAATVSGSGDIYGESKFNNLGGLLLGISGSGNIQMDFDAKDVKSQISGSGDMRLAGKANALEIKVSGSGDINAARLQTEKCSVKISGSGDAKVDVQEALMVSISGSGDVYYKGRPRIQTKISGSGDINSID